MLRTLDLLCASYRAASVFLEKEVAAHFSIVAWRIPWAEEYGGLQSIGSQKVGHRRGLARMSFS